MQIATIIKSIDDRVRLLGGHPPFLVKEFLESAPVAGFLPNLVQNPQYLEELLSDHQAIIFKLRKNREFYEKQMNLGMADFIIGILKSHEEHSQILSALLNQQSEF